MTTTTATSPTEETRTIQGPFRNSNGEIFETYKMTFAFWLKLTDRAVQRRTGLSADDLEDWDYMSAWEDGTPPHEAAREAVSNAGYDRAAY